MNKAGPGAGLTRWSSKELRAIRSGTEKLEVMSWNTTLSAAKIWIRIGNREESLSAEASKRKLIKRF